MSICPLYIAGCCAAIAEGHFSMGYGGHPGFENGLPGPENQLRTLMGRPPFHASCRKCKNETPHTPPLTGATVGIVANGICQIQQA